jgi:peptide/nickel transport system substrate-binding protein
MRLSTSAFVYRACVAAAVGVALLALSAAASGSSGSRSAIPLLKVGLAGDTIPVLDPGRAEGAHMATALSLETLMKHGSGSAVVPNLAVSVTHPNAETYIYRLRNGVKFWDGRLLTANDVANALNYYRYRGFTTSSAYTSVRDIKATGKLTVQVTLKHRDASWQFGPPVTGEIFEKAFQDAHKTTMGQPGTLIMGTGPWMPVSFDPLTGLELAANPHWWGGAVPIQHISIKLLSDDTSASLAMRSGAIDVVPVVTIPQPYTSTGSTVVSVPGCNLAIFTMNTKAAPWSDVHVRRAVAYAINRTEIVHALGASATPVSTVIAPSQLASIASQAQVKSLLASLPSYPFNLAKARAELAKSAYPHGFTASTVSYPAPPYTTINQAIAGQLQTIGIHLQVNTTTIGDWVAKWISGPRNQNPAGMIDGGCTSQDPGFYPQMLLNSKSAHAGGFNFADYTSPKVDAAIKAGIQTSSPAKRLAVYAKLLTQVGLDMPYVPLYLEPSSYAISSKLRWPSYSYSMLDNAWALGIKAG